MVDAPGQHQVEVKIVVAAEDADQLRFALGLPADGDISGFLRAVAQTGSEMLLDEVLGRADYPTKTVARQTRLFKLVTHAFDNTMPSAAVVAMLFHITPQAAATLIASTSARYARSLTEATANSVRTALTGRLDIRKADKNSDDNTYMFRCADVGVIRAIRAALEASADTVRPLTPDATAVNVYDIHATAVDVISQAFGLKREEMLTAGARERVKKQKSS